MFLVTLRKSLSLFYVGLCLVTFLWACQSQVGPASINEMELSPGNTALPTALPAVAKPAVTTRPSQSTPPAPQTPTLKSGRASSDGWLLFSSRRQDSNGDGIIDQSDGIHLYSLNLSTQELTQLTSGNHRDLYPVWSPDRSQIVFASNRDGNFELYVMNISESWLRRLTNTPEDETKPRWSPDGKQIIYVQVKAVDAGSPEKRLYLMSAIGNNIHELTEGPEDDNPDWSPDGRYVTFTRTKKQSTPMGSYLIETVNLLDMLKNQVFILTPQDSSHGIYYEPKWLPRSGYLLSMRQGIGDATSPDNIEIFELKWDGSQPTLDCVSGIAGIGNYVWGQNGDWLVAVVYNYNLVLSPVNLFTHGWTSIWEQGELISQDTFYVDFLDWAP